MLVDVDFQDLLLEASMIEQAADYFRGRYNTWHAKERALYIESSLNKVSAFLADDRIGARLAQPESAFSIKDTMDSGGVLLVNLAKGRLAGNADLFGALLMADIEMSFLLRQPVDEFQNVDTESFETVLTEARKFGLCLTMAHQSLKQLDDKLVSLILGNAQTQVYFRVSRQDAERLSKESASIVEQLYEREDYLIQEPEHKFTLMEMWEVAFHNLARLEPRKAYVMVKAVMEHPELMRTHENPVELPIEYPYSELYCSLGRLVISRGDRRKDIEMRTMDFVSKADSVADDDANQPQDLDFLNQ